MLSQSLQPFIYAALILLALAGVLQFMLNRARKRADLRIREAFGKIPAYEDEDLAYLTAYHKSMCLKDANANIIDDITWNDLSMDAVFQRINVCASSTGEEYLYHALHALKTNEADVQAREQLIRWLQEHPDDRLRLQRTLHGLGKRQSNGLATFLHHIKTKKLRWAWLYTILALLPIAGLVLAIAGLQAGFLVFIGAAIINVFVYMRKRMMLEGELETLRYFSALLYCSKSIKRHYASELKPLGLDLAAALAPFRRTGGMIPGSTQQLASDLESIVLLIKTVFLIDLILYNRTVTKLTQHTHAIHALYQIIGELDMAICIASYRHSLDFHCSPTFRQDNTLCFDDAYHPLIKDPVSNSGQLDNDCLITGSNASGKSTFIKTLAINNILAQTINTCCARQYALRFAYVASSMALKDNVLAGDSYFITEIKSLKRIIQYCQERHCVCFIDEILRGTNTPERIAASTAVLKLLHEYDCLCLVASHDIELTQILSGLYDNYHFSEQVDNDTIAFDYLLKPGPSRSTNAIRLLKYMGFDPRIVQEATAIIQANDDAIRIK